MLFNFLEQLEFFIVLVLSNQLLELLLVFLHNFNVIRRLIIKFFELFGLDELVAICNITSIEDLGVGGVKFAVENVFEDRNVHEMWFLHDQGDVRSEAVQVVLLDVFIVN